VGGGAPAIGTGGLPPPTPPTPLPPPPPPPGGLPRPVAKPAVPTNDESEYAGTGIRNKLVFRRFNNLYEEYKSATKQEIRIRKPLEYKHFDNLFDVYKQCKKYIL
jgi:hypothetical protein